MRTRALPLQMSNTPKCHHAGSTIYDSRRRCQSRRGCVGALGEARAFDVALTPKRAADELARYIVPSMLIDWPRAWRVSGLSLLTVCSGCSSRGHGQTNVWFTMSHEPDGGLYVYDDSTYECIGEDAESFSKGGLDSNTTLRLTELVTDDLMAQYADGYAATDEACSLSDGAYYMSNDVGTSACWAATAVSEGPTRVMLDYVSALLLDLCQ
jgi:hypothetical protein